MKRDPQARRGQIIAAAGAVFAADGFAGARVDTIAAAAGLNKRLLYHYVGDKTAVFVAVLEHEAQQLDEVFRLQGPERRRRFWRLLLEENAHLDEPLLGPALIRYLREAAGDGVTAEVDEIRALKTAGGSGTETAGVMQELASQLALDLLDALLPDLLGSLLGTMEDAPADDRGIQAGRQPAGDQGGGAVRRKPKVRMVPTVLRSGEGS